MQTAVGIETRVAGRTSLSFNFVNSRGLHIERQRDINAPLR